jgi:hypothetical protein
MKILVKIVLLSDLEVVITSIRKILISLYLCLYPMSVCPSVFPSIRHSVCLPVRPSFRLFIYLSLSLLCVFVSKSVSLDVNIVPACLFYLYIQLFIYLPFSSFCLSVCPSILLSVHPYY